MRIAWRITTGPSPFWAFKIVWLVDFGYQGVAKATPFSFKILHQKLVYIKHSVYICHTINKHPTMTRTSTLRLLALTTAIALILIASLYVQLHSTTV